MSEIIKMLDERLKQLDDRQIRIEAKIDNMMQTGCAKAEAHRRVEDNQESIFKRLVTVELAQAEGRGKMVVLGVIACAAMGAFFAWVGGMWK